MDLILKIENEQLIKWCYEKEAIGLSNKLAYIIMKIKERNNYSIDEIEKISKKLKKVFFPHLKSRMILCRHDKKRFEKKVFKIFENFLHCEEIKL